MVAKIALAFGLLIPILALLHVLTLFKGSGNSAYQHNNQIEPVFHQPRPCDPVNDPASCEPS